VGSDQLRSVWLVWCKIMSVICAEEIVYKVQTVYVRVGFGYVGVLNTAMVYVRLSRVVLRSV
jgi:hypothetical protein